MDIEELKRLHAERYSGYRCNAAWLTAVESNFPAILAKLEAAQRLRDEAAEMLKRVNANQSPEGLLTSNQWKPMAWLELHRAVAAFDKEQQ